MIRDVYWDTTHLWYDIQVYRSMMKWYILPVDNYLNIFKQCRTFLVMERDNVAGLGQICYTF